MPAKNFLKHLIASVLLICTRAVAETTPSGPIRLGATLPLTGDIAPYGNLIRDGIELALSDLRARGLEASITYEDVPSPGPHAVTAINRLVTEKHINGLAGNFWNPVIPIIAPAVMNAKVVSFHTAAADDPILEAGDFVFSTNTKIKDEAATVAEYVYRDMGADSACVLYIGTNFGENYCRHFMARFKELGGKIPYYDLTKLGEDDLRTVLMKVKNSPCKVFFAAYFGTNLGLVLKQAKIAGLSKPTLAVYEAEDPSVLEVAGEAAEGLLFFVPEPVVDSMEISDYKTRFSAKFGYAPRILASNAYDATTILVTTMSACGLDPECVKSKIYALRNYPGMSGKFSIDPDGAARKAFVLKTVKKGRFERVASGIRGGLP